MLRKARCPWLDILIVLIIDDALITFTSTSHFHEQAFDDFPIRVDLEAAAIDVVWRDRRSSASTVVRGDNSRLKPSHSSSKDGVVDAGHYREGQFTFTTLNTNTTVKAAIERDKYGNKIIPKQLGSKRDILPTQYSVLRRERFNFDDVFAGNSALGRLAAFTRQRTRKALETGRNLTFLCLACGDAPAGDIEPTVAMLLGNSGGTGLLSQVVDEAFDFVQPTTTQMGHNPAALSHLNFISNSGRGSSKTNAKYLAARVASEQSSSRVSLSALLFQSDVTSYYAADASRFRVVDLFAQNNARSASSVLSDRSSWKTHAAQACISRRHVEDPVTFKNITKVSLRCAADVERVVGMLIGKKAAVQEVLSTLRSFNDTVVDEVASIVETLSVWQSFSRRQHRRPATNGNDHHQEHDIDEGNSDDDCEDANISSSNQQEEPDDVLFASMLITLSVAVGAGKPVLFHFVCPCGNGWSVPGSYRAA